MPKIIISIPDDINKKLKKYALDNGRSLSQFLPRYITACVENSIIKFDERGEFEITPTSTTTTAGLMQVLDADPTIASATVKYAKPGITSTQHTDTDDLVKYTKRVTALINIHFPEAKEDAHYYNDMLLPGIRPSVYGDTDDAIISTIKSFRENYLADDDDDEEELYDYQYELETIREPKLIIPLNENSIYRKIKSYAIRNRLTDLLYRVMEYPLATVEYYINDPDDELSEKLIRPALESQPANDYKYEQEEIDALNHALEWDDE